MHFHLDLKSILFHPIYEMGVKSQRILITGAAKKIGSALTEHFALQGWHVIAHYHSSREAAVALQEKIILTGMRCDLVNCDLTEEKEVRQLIPTINQTWGTVDVVINNAAVFIKDTAKTATQQSWAHNMAVNLRAPFVLAQTFAQQEPLPRAGVILNIIDQRVWNITPYFTSYTLSKIGLWGLTQMLALSLAPDIRVNAIGPGLVLPPSQLIHEKTPLKLSPSVTDICRSASFLIESKSITGQMLAIDSGQHLGWAFPH